MWYQPQCRGFIWPRNSSGGFTSNPPWAPCDCRRATRWRSTAPWTFPTPISTTPSFGPRMARIWKNTNLMRSTTSKPSQMVSQVSFPLSGNALACHCNCNANEANSDGCVLVHCRIKNVQRSDAGEYRCRLSVSQMVVESQPIIVKVEGEIQPCDSALFLIYCALKFFSTQLCLMCRPASIRPPAAGQECNKRRSFHFILRGGWSPRPGPDPLAPGWIIR